MIDDQAIASRLDTVDQYKSRRLGLDIWEAAAPEEEVAMFRAYVRVWLRKREAGAVIGWKAFAEILRSDIPSFDLMEQGLKGALLGRIERL